MATTNVLYARNAELYMVLQNLLPERTADDPVFNDIMPVKSIAEQIIAFEQRDGFFGKTPARALGTGFGQITREGRQRITVGAVPYGEEKVMDEQFMLQSREIGQFGKVIDLTDEQMSDQLHLMDRFIKLFKYNVWQLLTTGTYSALGPNGELVGGDSYQFASFTVAVDWNNYANSTPLLDLRTLKLKHRGQSVKFDKRAKIYMQSIDVNNLLSNTNPNDLGAKRVITNNAGAQPMSLADVNRFLLDNDLPQIIEYDEFLPTSAATFGVVANFTMFIPQGTAVCIGYREYGEPLANYVMTPTWGHVIGRDMTVKDISAEADNAFANIYFDYRLDYERWEAKSRIAFAGAPVVHYPSAIATMNLQP